MSSAETPVRRRGRARLIRVIGAWVLLALGAVVFIFLVWAHAVYQAERPAAMQAFALDDVSISVVDEGVLLSPLGSAPEHSTGLVFVPGARVEPTAYLWQLSGIVELHGVTVLVTRPTVNLAFFDARELDDFATAAPNVDRWFVGGHSLGGVRACLMAENALDDERLAGLVLLGSYCANDLSASDVTVVSVAAENDGLSTRDTIESRAGLLPPSTVFAVIEGANHASFGDYGPQSGDGERTITSDEMREQLTAVLANVVAAPAD